MTRTKASKPVSKKTTTTKGKSKPTTKSSVKKVETETTRQKVKGNAVIIAAKENKNALGSSTRKAPEKPAPRLVVNNYVNNIQNIYKPVRPATKNVAFQVGDYVVYPTHGVGRITALETQDIAGHQLKLYVIAFDKDRMVLRVPMNRAQITGLRPLSDKDELSEVMSVLKLKARVAKGMWSKRAQEYESKINSGSIVYLAEVVRDLHRNVDHPERSYSERVIYENAFNRLAREIAAVESIDHDKAGEKLVRILSNKKVAA